MVVRESEGVRYYIRLDGGVRVGNWPTREAAEATARNWADGVSYGPESVEEGPAPHDLWKCPCSICRGQREAHTYLTVPCRF